MAGNISHLKIWPKGKLCECGQRGCMRQYTSAKALLGMMKQASLDDGDKNQTIPRLVEWAVNGDNRAIRIVRKAGQALGIAIGHMTNSMGIQQVVINSDLNNTGSAFLDPINNEARRAVSDGDFNPRISFSALEGYAGSLGAAVMAMQQVCGTWEDVS